MNLNKQNDFNNLLLQKRERRMSEISNNQQIETDNIYKEETDSTKPSTKNSENKILYLKGRNVSHTELKNNQEFNIIPPTVKISNSRKMSSNSLDSRTVCNCKNSQCLKLYCECFSTMSYCDPKLCSCKNCMNTVENEVKLHNIIKYIIFISY